MGSLLLEEHFTVTLPSDPSVEIDRIDTYAFYHGREPRTPNLWLLKETEEPHTHAYAAGRWWRIDRTTHRDFALSAPARKHLPSIRTDNGRVLATNQDIATLLVLLVEGIKRG